MIDEVEENEQKNDDGIVSNDEFRMLKKTLIHDEELVLIECDRLKNKYFTDSEIISKLIEFCELLKEE